jgi:hypothetical protein
LEIEMARERKSRLKERRKKPQGESLYRFDWPVDQHGYDIVTLVGTGESLLEQATNDVIRARGGAPRFYRPMEDEPGLWREFAETCTSPESALVFTTRFGDLFKPDMAFATRDLVQPDSAVENVLRGAKLIRHIVELMDSKRLPEAIEFFKKNVRANAHVWIDSKGELRPIPTNLLSALLIQAGEALTRGHTFGRCQNPRCSTWFRVGTGASTIRRKFCSDRCRVAVDRAKAKR